MSDALIEYPCPECGKPFHSKLALQGHKTSHRTPLPCPECGKQYRTAGALGNHRKNTHGVASGTGNTNPSGRPKRTAVAKEWKVEDIFTAVLDILYPNGAVPIGAIPALIVWRDDTQRMLEKVMHD